MEVDAARKAIRDASRGTKQARHADATAASAVKNQLSRNKRQNKRRRAAAAALKQQQADEQQLLQVAGGIASPAEQHDSQSQSSSGSDDATPPKRMALHVGPYTKAAPSTQRKRAAAAAACVLQAPNAAAQAEVLTILHGRGDMQEVLSMAGMKPPKEQQVSNMIMGNIAGNLKLVAASVGGQVTPHHAAYTTVLEMSMGANIPEANMVSAASRLLGASRVAVNKAVTSSIDKRLMHEAGITRIDWGRCRRNRAASNSITQQQVDVIWDSWEHNSTISPSQKDIRTYSFFDRIRCVSVSMSAVLVCRQQPMA